MKIFPHSTALITISRHHPCRERLKPSQARKPELGRPTKLDASAHFREVPTIAGMERSRSRSDHCGHGQLQCLKGRTHEPPRARPHPLFDPALMADQDRIDTGIGAAEHIDIGIADK